MKFTLDSKEMFSHLVLEDDNVATTIAETSEWKDNGTLTAELKINGVVIPAEVLDKFLNKLWEQAQVDSGAEEFQRKVEEEANHIFKEMNSDLYNMMFDLHQKLEYYEGKLKFPWDK